MFRLTASGVPPPGAVFFFCLLLRSVLSKTFILSGIYLIEQIEQMLYYLNLKSKKIYKISNIRELSKDVFYLFYTLKSLDISGVFTEQMCERMCAT